METEAAGNRVEVAAQPNEDGVSADDMRRISRSRFSGERTQCSNRLGNVTVDSVHGDMTDTVGADPAFRRGRLHGRQND